MRERVLLRYIFVVAVVFRTPTKHVGGGSALGSLYFTKMLTTSGSHSVANLLGSRTIVPWSRHYLLRTTLLLRCCFPVR